MRADPANQNVQPTPTQNLKDASQILFVKSSVDAKERYLTVRPTTHMPLSACHKTLLDGMTGYSTVVEPRLDRSQRNA